ncbi:hypothetical protein IGI80_003629 [Enterococcus sp. DIV1420a]
MELYFWLLVIVILAILGLGLYFREWFYIYPKEREKHTGKKTTFLEYIVLILVSLIILVIMFWWQYIHQN